MARLIEELKRRNVVRVAVAYIVVGWVVTQISQLLFEAFGTPDWVIKTVIVLIGIGFPFALLFAWAFELTPDGLKKTREVHVTQSITDKTGQRLNYLIIASLVVALGYFIWERQLHDHVEAPADVIETPVAAAVPETALAEEAAQTSVRRSIAVLPFVSMSSDKEQEWFADGLTEEILNSLAKAKGLLVTARTTSFGYKGSTDPIPDIAKEIGVDHVLEGSVRRGGETVRITAQLIRAADGFHLWSETFDRKLDDIIAIQEEIAIEIAKALNVAMDPDELAAMTAAGTSSVAAYEAYLQGIGAFRASGESGDPYDSVAALDYFEQAVELDPKFSRAWSWQWGYWSLQADANQLVSGTTEFSRDDILKKRDYALDQAIANEDDEIELIGYRAARAGDRFDYQTSWRLSKEYYEHRPDADGAFESLMVNAEVLGLHDEIRDFTVQRLESGSEVGANFYNIIAQVLRHPGHYDLMRELGHRAIEEHGEVAGAMYQVHRSLLFAGDIDGASRIVPTLMSSELPEANRRIVELRHACAEQRADAEEVYRRFLEDFANDPEKEVWTWMAHKTYGNDEAAQAVLMQFDERKDFETMDSYLGYSNFEPAKYPNFARRVAGQGIVEREVIPISYRCLR